jgi:hypothetical protein
MDISRCHLVVWIPLNYRTGSGSDLADSQHTTKVELDRHLTASTAALGLYNRV